MDRFNVKGGKKIKQKAEGGGRGEGGVGWIPCDSQDCQLI